MSKPARSAISAAATNSAFTRSMSARSMRFGDLVLLRPGHVGGREQRPVPLRQRRVHLLPAELRRALAAGMADLRADLRVRLGVHEIDDALPGALVLRRIEAGAAGRDAPFRADAGHLDMDEAGAALGALRVVHEVPVRRAAVDGLVLRHGRDDDAVLQRQLAQLVGREHRRARDIVGGAGAAAGTTPRRSPAIPCRAAGGSRG